ncbi:MAG: 5'-nucleotidase C-terminal domain-containing protein [Deltaproteobacteria bacterium]|nr:5'-nucleotidase C-terminal domain-containing protein [Deltaproteobacteria bacterium]
MKYLGRLVLGTAVVGLLTSCVVRPEQYEIDGTDVSAVFLHTSDIHSRLLPYDMDVMLTDRNLGLSPENAPFGGIARLAAVVKQTRRDFGRVAYIDTGDVFQGAPIFNSFLGEPEFRALTQLKVDAFAIGNHEFDNGTEHMVTQARQFANFPMIAANYILSDPSFEKNIATGRVASPYTIINLKGLRVGVIGLGYVGGSPKFGGSSKGVIALRHKDTVQQWVDFLRPIVDVVAVASHASYHTDLEYIPRTEGVDIVFGGHLHIVLSPPTIIQDCDITRLKRERDQYICDTPEKLRLDQELCKQKTCADKTAGEKAQCEKDCLDAAQKACRRQAHSRRYDHRLAELDADIKFLEDRKCYPRDVLLVHSGAFLKYVGQLQATFRQCHRLPKTVCLERGPDDKCAKSVPRRCVGGPDTRNDWEVVASKYKLVGIDKSLPEDPQMLQLLEPFTIELNQQQLLTQVVGYTPRRLYRFSKGTGDSELGNLVTDAMVTRNQVWADFAISNSLGIRSDIVAGPVYNEQMTNVFPFENSITVMYLSGYEVQEMMDFVSQRSASRGCQSQAQVSGLTAVLNCGGCKGSGENVCIRQDYDGVACAQRVTVGGTGRACATDKDCERDSEGKATGEICTKQRHPDLVAVKAGKPYRCWMPISTACTRNYRLATNDYIDHGGSGFTVLARNTTQKNLKIPLRDATKDYIVGMPACAQIPLTYKEAVMGQKPRLLIDEQGRAQLQAMEAKANAGDVAGADKDYQAFVKGLEDRRASIAAKIQAVPDGDEKDRLMNDRYAVESYLGNTDGEGCVSEAVSKASKDKGRCLGLTCFQLKQCIHYAPNDVARCRSLIRIRSALRCLSLPCVRAGEDGRIQRIFKDAAGPPHTDPDYPG